MANKTKTKTKTETVKTDVSYEEAVSMNVASTVSKNSKQTKREFRDSDYILCRSVWSGGLTVTCKSGAIYEFNKYGADCDIEYRDLIYLIRKNSDHIFTPRFVIMDDDFLEEFPQIKNLYSNMYTPTELHKIIELPIPQMKEEIAKLPNAAKTTLLSLIATEIAKGRLDSIRKVKVLSDIFESDFNLLSELFSD